MKLKKDNHGVTLMELIVVMLIMAILAVGTVTGYNLFNVGSAKHAAEKINTKLGYVQIENMTKSEIYSLVIEKDEAEGDYKLSILYGSSQLETTEFLKLKEGQITYQYDNLETHTVGTGDKLVISFRKDTGGIKADSLSGLTVTRIGITSSGKTYDIRLVPATGKHFIE
jgi:prepilin-type N-terminal cleavage/methylation domain-containing protein